MLRWRGRISVWESLEVLPASLGVGLLNSSQFIGLSAAVEKSHSATAISIFFLSQQLGMMIGASASAALLRHGFRDALIQKLTGWPDRDRVSTMSNICKRERTDQGGYLKTDRQGCACQCTCSDAFAKSFASDGALKLHTWFLVCFR